jgi:hypothetical protein
MLASLSEARGNDLPRATSKPLPPRLLFSTARQTKRAYAPLLMQGLSQPGALTKRHLSALLCGSCTYESPAVHAPKANDKFKSEPALESNIIRATPQGSSRAPRRKFQNPGYRTPKRSALSVFLKNLTQNGACELFALEHVCASGFPFDCSAQPFACSPARSRFLPTRLPCCAPSRLSAAIAAAQNPKFVAAA